MKTQGLLEGKNAIITRAGGGIGRPTALALARAGAHVVVSDIERSTAEETATLIRRARGQAIVVIADISQEGDWSALVGEAVQAFGGLDILVNNAAATSPKDRDLLSMEADVWDFTFAINARGPMLGCKHAIPRLLARGGGAIVNISSGAALTGQLGIPAYSAAKAATISLTRSVATLHGRQGIRCNAIAPGLIMHQRLAAYFPQEQIRIDAENLLARESGTPEDIANAVVFLASEQARFINGHVLPVDGGILAHTPFYAQVLALGQGSVAYSGEE